MTKLFITGVTGFIGGDVLHTIVEAHPEYEITALVRNTDKGALVASRYAKVKLVYGDLDSYDLIVEEASKADVVCNFADADHEGAAKAIVAGLAQRPTPSFYIHTSGTANLSIHDMLISSHGLPSNKTHTDYPTLTSITSLPASALHTNVDRIVLAATPAHPTVKTAIVCPPTIFGPGRGPGNKKSAQIPLLARFTLERGKAFMIGEGRNTWCQVHVHDLSRLYLRLVEEAASGGGDSANGGSGGVASWGDEGYYFAENGEEFAWGDVSRRVAEEAFKRGLVESKEVQSLGVEEANKMFWFAEVAWGMNARCRAVRAREVLGWECKEGTLWKTVGDVVEDEARGLELTKGHAAKAAGEA